MLHSKKNNPNGESVIWEDVNVLIKKLRQHVLHSADHICTTNANGLSTTFVEAIKLTIMNRVVVQLTTSHVFSHHTILYKLLSY
jgi:hypothetical protein